MNVGALSGVLANWSIDWVIILVFAVLVALDTLRSGSSRAAALILAAPLTLTFVASLPQAFIAGPALQQLTSPAAQILLFAVMFAVLFLIVHRIVFSYSENGGALQAVLSGAAAAAVFTSVWLQIPALQSVWHFGPQVQIIFGDMYRLWWLVAAYLTLAVVRG